MFDEQRSWLELFLSNETFVDDTLAAHYGLPLPGAPKGPQETAMVQTSRWMSAACPAGMSAGDIALPGGIRVNVKQLKGLHKLLPNIQIR